MPVRQLQAEKANMFVIVRVLKRCAESTTALSVRFLAHRIGNQESSSTILRITTDLAAKSTEIRNGVTYQSPAASRRGPTPLFYRDEFGKRWY